MLVVVHVVGPCDFSHIFWLLCLHGCRWMGFSRVAIHVAAQWSSFLTSSQNGSRSACTPKESIGVILSAPVEWRGACHCTCPNLLMNPLVPLICLVCGVRKRSVVYSM